MLSFTKDGNLPVLASSYAGGGAAFLNAVIASVPNGKFNEAPIFYDNPSNSDFNTTTGTVSWFEAKAYVSYINNISYGGNNQWNLSGVTNPEGTAGCNTVNNGTDAVTTVPKLLLAREVPFINLKSFAYWSGNEYAPCTALIYKRWHPELSRRNSGYR